MAVLGLRCCTRPFPSTLQVGGCLPVVVRGRLIAVVSMGRPWALGAKASVAAALWAQ